jgi:uncharacterized membrane protein
MHLSKKAREYLLITLIVGGLCGVVDSGEFEIASFIGGGLGVLILSVVLGIVINLVMLQVKRSAQSNQTEVLDQDAQNGNQNRDSRILNTNVFKYGLIVSLVFLALSLLKLAF